MQLYTRFFRKNDDSNIYKFSFEQLVPKNA